ncbi:hypothetical protein [Microcoleus sp. B13-B4]|uniref:hypothetical protein n=1 Tax=unclassified Microcoleus TaxID=2642155 RepID=UPI002FD3F4B6
MIKATQVIFDWMTCEIKQRNPQAIKTLVVLMDGQASLWEQSVRSLTQSNRLEILDLLHVTSRIWTAAHLFCEPNSNDAIALVKDYVLLTLQGKVGEMIEIWQKMAKNRRFKGQKQEYLQKLINYFENNKNRMRYDIYLAAGIPLLLELLKALVGMLLKTDRNELVCAGQFRGAQAMLELRSTYLNRDWDKFIKFRIQNQHERLYPYRSLVETTPWPMAA